MWPFRVETVKETGMEKAFHVTLPTPDGEADVYGFSESQLNPDKCSMAHTSMGNFNVENTVQLAVYMDEDPAQSLIV